jgi:hypothetical protein
VELYNRFLKTDDTLPGAKTMTLLIAEASLLSVKNVFATPGRSVALEGDELIELKRFR